MSLWGRRAGVKRWCRVGGQPSVQPPVRSGARPGWSTRLAMSGHVVGSIPRSDCPDLRPHPEARLAILLAMSLAEQMPLADVKNRLSEVVDRLQREHGRIVITRHGRPAAVVLSVDDLESLEETLDVMGSTQLMADVREALDELDSTSTTVLSKDEALHLATGR